MQKSREILQLLPQKNESISNNAIYDITNHKNVFFLIVVCLSIESD